MADADVVLDGKTLRLDGDLIVTGATDLMIDNPDRRKINNVVQAGLYRRALVHGFNDVLTLNWDGDYKGGVRIVGPLVANGSLAVDGSVKSQAGLECKGNFKAGGQAQCVGDMAIGGYLSVNNAGSFVGDVTISFKTPISLPSLNGLTFTPPTYSISVLAEITLLRSVVRDMTKQLLVLQDEVLKLKAKVK